MTSLDLDAKSSSPDFQQSHCIYVHSNFCPPCHWNEEFEARYCVSQCPISVSRFLFGVPGCSQLMDTNRIFSQGPPKLPPKILNSGERIRVRLGDNITLPCVVQNFQSKYGLSWTFDFGLFSDTYPALVNLTLFWFIALERYLAGESSSCWCINEVNEPSQRSS